jgi:hypothetical protein
LQGEISYFAEKEAQDAGSGALRFQQYAVII